MRSTVSMERARRRVQDLSVATSPKAKGARLLPTVAAGNVSRSCGAQLAASPSALESSHGIAPLYPMVHQPAPLYDWATGRAARKANNQSVLSSGAHLERSTRSSAFARCRHASAPSIRTCKPCPRRLKLTRLSTSSAQRRMTITFNQLIRTSTAARGRRLRSLEAHGEGTFLMTSALQAISSGLAKMPLPQLRGSQGARDLPHRDKSAGANRRSTQSKAIPQHAYHNMQGRTCCFDDNRDPVWAISCAHRSKSTTRLASAPEDVQASLEKRGIPWACEPSVADIRIERYHATCIGSKCRGN